MAHVPPAVRGDSMPDRLRNRYTSVVREHKQEMTNVRQALRAAGVAVDNPEHLARTLPFTAGDVTAGAESELQAVVAGDRHDVDLPLIIEQSNYFANMMKRTASGEAPRKVLADLERFLADNTTGVWENSWVRFSPDRLSGFARQVLEDDLLADKRNRSAGRRADADRFFYRDAAGRELIRLPISYLLKLALADLIGSQQFLPVIIRATGTRLLDHYLNDNTSPETFSFNVVTLTPDNGMGAAIAAETALRFLLTQLLLCYANRVFALADSGQRAMAYFAPHPPVRQKELNDHVSDSFYRELFMSPCLSGWDRGEEKFRYMQLCHQVLSRSQLNAVAKLRDAGIILNNLVVLPSVSNVSLANNGTHISLGSRRLTRLLADGTPEFHAGHEKLLGDLVIKITEHFLPLFVGTYTAAPFRLAFTDFHPEKALGFLPHELDYTHLRMLWRRWRKKADISLFGQSLTPFGPVGLDTFLGNVFRLKGDFVPDYRLVDYLVCLLSTDRSPALNGQVGNGGRLRRDLADLGVFDEQMSLYLLYKLREFGTMGFSGFEGRHYSLFGSFRNDLGRAADLQTLMTALAYQYMAQGLAHSHIPDAPSIESERRQIFFGAAIGIPTFFVRRDTGNAFLAMILAMTGGVRPSRRYPGYLRVPLHEYRLALVRLLRRDAADLIALLDLEGTITDLEHRLHEPRLSAAGRLTAGILDVTGTATALTTPAREFNCAAEHYYRTTLRQQQMAEALDLLHDACRLLDREAAASDEIFRTTLRLVLHDRSAAAFVDDIRDDVLHERLAPAPLRRLINLVLLKVWHDEHHATAPTCRMDGLNDATPVYRAG